MMENMVVETPSKVRFVRCPKCRKLLPEPPGVPLYSCGGCGTFLQGRTSVDEKDLPNAINESRREEDVATAPEEETVHNEAAMKMENQSAAVVMDKEESSCLSVPHSEPRVEEEESRNCEDEVDTTVASNVGSDQGVETVDQIVADTNVSTSDSITIIEQEAAQNNGSTSNRSSSFNGEETAEETICQETTYFATVINESTERSHNEQLEHEFLQSGEETVFISEEEQKLREELILLNHQTPDEDSVSEMLMIKGLNPVRRTHPTRYRTRSESYGQSGPAKGPLNQEREKFIYSSGLQSEQEKTELLRIMVLELEEQVRRMRQSEHSPESETMSVKMNRFYSGTLNRTRNQFSPRSIFSSSQQPRRYYSPSPSWDFESKSVDQLSDNSRFSYQLRERVHVPKRHIRPVAGASPVVTCYRCSSVLQLPEDFLLSKRKRFHWLKCGSCLTVLRFSLQNGTHIVPSREGSKRETEPARLKRGSALHKLMGYSSVTQLVIGSGESNPSDQTSV